MTRFRLWLANLISGGEIARLNEDAECYVSRLRHLDDGLYCYEVALQSIANNTCCEGCQEAARVAREALE